MLGRNFLPHPASFLLMTAESALQGFYHTFLWRNSVQPRYGGRCDSNSKSFCTYATVLLAPTSSTNHHRRLESLQQSYKKHTRLWSSVDSEWAARGSMHRNFPGWKNCTAEISLHCFSPFSFLKKRVLGCLIYNIQRLCNAACLCVGIHALNTHHGSYAFSIKFLEATKQRWKNEGEIWCTRNCPLTEKRIPELLCGPFRLAQQYAWLYLDALLSYQGIGKLQCHCVFKYISRIRTATSHSTKYEYF